MTRPVVGDEESAQRLRFLVTLCVAVRNARAFEIHSQTAIRSLDELFEAASALLGLSTELTLRATDTVLALNGIRLSASRSAADFEQSLLREMKAHHLAEIELDRGLTREELASLVYLLARASTQADPSRLEGELRRLGVTHARVEYEVESEGGADQSSKAQSVAAYFASTASVRDCMQSQEEGRGLDVRSLKHAARGMVSAMLRDDFHLRALANNLRSYDEYTYCHSANVSILSVAFAMHLGAGKGVLGNIGVAGLLHDIGKLRVPGDVLMAERPLTEQEWESMHEHPRQGAWMLLRAPSYSASTATSVAVCLEHHLGIGTPGYPAVEGYGGPSFFARMVSVVDCYDALRTPRPYRPMALTPGEAFETMLSSAGTKLDPAILRRFIQFQGLFPVGTEVELSDGHKALVRAQNPTMEQMDRPVVMLMDEGKNGTRPLLDLAEPDCRISIVGIAEPPRSREEMERYIEAL